MNASEFERNLRFLDSMVSKVREETDRVLADIFTPEEIEELYAQVDRDLDGGAIQH